MRVGQTIAAVLMALLVLCGLGDARGLVLCLETDGHAQIELAQEGCCADLFIAERSALPHHNRHTLQSPIDAPLCGACVDIPFGFGDQHAVVLQYLGPVLKAPVATASVAGPYTSERCTTQLVHEAQGAGSNAILSLRTTILVI